MTDQTALYLFLGLLGVQFVAFFTAMAFWMSSRQFKDEASRARAGWRSNIASAIGFASMSVLSFVVAHYVPAESAFTTWLSGVFFGLFSAFLLWLGIKRRSLSSGSPR